MRSNAAYRSILLLFIMGYIAAVGGAGPLAAASPLSGGDESDRANAFFDKVFEELIARSPQFQTELGRKIHYDRWDDLSEAYTAATHALVERQLAELRASIDPGKLDEQTHLSYDLFVTEWERRLRDYTWRHHDYPVNQMYGLQSNVPSFLINYHKIDSTTDAEAYIARLEAIPKLFAQQIEGLKIRASEGIVAPKFVFAYVLDDSRNITRGRPFDDSDENSTILEDFRKKVEALDGVSEADKRALVDRAALALTESVGPAYRSLIAYVTDLEETATTDDGAWKLPRGDDFYRYQLRKMTTTELTPNEVHDIGRAEVARIHGEMREIMRELGFEGTLQEFFDFMRNDERFYYDESDGGREAYLAAARDIIDTMHGRLDDLFTIQPKAEIIVKAVEPFRERSAGKAFYERPSPDGKRPGIYYANLYRMSDMPTYQMEALAYHEGIPGHHMQIAITLELGAIPMFRKYARYTAYTEGWALYTEFLPKEIGFYENPYSDFGRLAMELWRACRLVVDTGIHDKKWTREQAIEYLGANTPNPHGDAVKAIERYIVMPGQATAYKIGMLRILELREEARDRLGDGFDIREFHDVVIRNGPVPLNTLERLVDQWVDTKM